jgi:hypothetical protein
LGVFVVPAAAAAQLIAPSGFTIAKVAPGKALLSVVCGHYTDTDCGSYEEIALVFFVNKEGARRRLPYVSTWADILRGDVASYCWRLGVTSVLARNAGIEMWGFPKTLEAIEYSRQQDRASFCWRSGEQTVLRYSLPTQGRRNPATYTAPIYSEFEGNHHISYLTQTYRQAGYQLRGAELELGSHVLAEELRGLGLPRRPLVAAWYGELVYRMSAPERLYDW